MHYPEIGDHLERIVGSVVIDEVIVHLSKRPPETALQFYLCSAFSSGAPTRVAAQTVITYISSKN